MPFKNLPTGSAAPLVTLVEARPGQVSSRSLTRIGDPLAATLLAFAEGESVSEETYAGDTLYYLVEGKAEVNAVQMTAGDVPAGTISTSHAVRPVPAAKILQLTLI